MISASRGQKDDEQEDAAEAELGADLRASLSDLQASFDGHVRRTCAARRHAHAAGIARATPTDDRPETRASRRGRVCAIRNDRADERSRARRGGRASEVPASNSRGVEL